MPEPARIYIATSLDPYRETVSSISLLYHTKRVCQVCCLMHITGKEMITLLKEQYQKLKKFVILVFI